MDIEKALEDIRKGKPILVYDFDDRERESDMTVASEFVTGEVIRKMRMIALIGLISCRTLWA